MSNVSTPLLKSFDGYNSVNRGPSKRKIVSTEDIVNAAGDAPSLLFLIVIFGIFTFNMILPSAVFFPNFGGHVPYDSWRCNNSSKECFDRTKYFSASGWKNWSAQNEAVESRCLLDFSHMIFDTSNTVPTIQIFQNMHTKLGSLHFDLNRKDQQIKVQSFVNCENGEVQCQKIFSVNFGPITEELECRLDFGHSSSISKNASISCNSISVYLADEFGVLPVIDGMDFVRIYNIDRYNLHCPDTKQYNKVEMCGAGGADRSEQRRELEVGADFHWRNNGRNSFSIDWGLYCGKEYLQTVIGSVYFAGGLLGAFFGGMLYDTIGRKRGTLVGYLTLSVTTFIIAASPSIYFLIVCRFFQGIGAAISVPGLTILALEYVPQKFRAAANSSLQVLWSLGYLLATLIGYLIGDWHWLAATAGFLFVGSMVPLLLIPESPRFLLETKNNKESAKASLRWLIWLNRSDYDIDSVELEEISKNKQSSDNSFTETLKDIWKYKALLVQILLQVWVWLVCGFLYYGFGFSWGSFGSNMYYSYMYAAIAELIAYLGMTFPLEYWGRKASNITFLLVASAACLVALIPYNVTQSISVEQLSCLVGSMLIAASFGSLYLYTMELSPTTHRGKIMGSCSVFCRTGSSLGPQAGLLFNWSRSGTLLIFAVLSGLAGLAVCGLPDTTGLPTPNTAQEVQQRRDKKNNRSQSYEKTAV